MSLTDADLEALRDLATRAAREAGDLVASKRPSVVELKSVGASRASRIVTEVDRIAQEHILQVLAPTVAQFELGLLTEETRDDGSRFRSEYFWAVDPLDGTLPYVDDVPGYAVSIALVGRDGRPWIGAVFDPVSETSFSAARGMGMLRNDRPWTPVVSAQPHILHVFADRSFVDDPGIEDVEGSLNALARDLALESFELKMGAGAVVNACSVLENGPACYFKFPKAGVGGGSLWDFAATACLFEEAGAVVTDIHGDPLELNRSEGTYMNHRGVLYASGRHVASGIETLWKRMAEDSSSLEL